MSCLLPLHPRNLQLSRCPQPHRRTPLPLLLTRSLLIGRCNLHRPPRSQNNRAQRLRPRRRSTPCCNLSRYLLRPRLPGSSLVQRCLRLAVPSSPPCTCTHYPLHREQTAAHLHHRGSSTLTRQYPAPPRSTAAPLPHHRGCILYLARPLLRHPRRLQQSPRRC